MAGPGGSTSSECLGAPEPRRPAANGERAVTSAIRAALAFLIAGLITLSAGAGQDDPTLQYQRRGDRLEGLRDTPVAGLDVELLSARIDATEVPSTPTWGEKLRARFYLPEKASLYLTVRQLRSQATYYWLDYPEPPERAVSWQVGGMNEYGWDTVTVLKQLRNVRREDLGAVVRVGRRQPGRLERVLPVDLSDRAPMQMANRYRFSLKTNGKARVTADVFSRDGNKKLYTRPANWEQAGSPITVIWDAQAEEGWYRLVLSGNFEEGNKRLDKEIEFYHRPRLGAAGAPR